jgi:hypothetical protein
MQNCRVLLPDHGLIMAGPSPHTTESTHPAEEAWRNKIRHGAPLQLHIFFVFCNDFSFSHSRNHAFCMVFYPCMLLLQCVLTRKTCHALSSLGVVLLMQQILVIPIIHAAAASSAVNPGFRPTARGH